MFFKMPCLVFTYRYKNYIFSVNGSGSFLNITKYFSPELVHNTNTKQESKSTNLPVKLRIDKDFPANPHYPDIKRGLRAQMTHTALVVTRTAKIVHEANPEQL